MFQNIMIEHDAAETLMAERAFDCIGFTGSVAGGRTVEKPQLAARRGGP